jgi:hypothetical protein
MTPDPSQLGPLHAPPCNVRPPFDQYRPDPAAAAYGHDPARWRQHRHNDALAAILEPLDGVELGDYDRRMIDWLAGFDDPTVGTFVSLLWRLRAHDGQAH